MRVDETSPQNVGVFRLVRSILRDQPPVASPDSVEDPYREQGSHPDVVERVWDELGRALPTDCRCLVYGTPSLVHPGAGVVLAFTLGTGYFVRLPAGAARTGAEPRIGWQVDAAHDLGADWVDGRWAADEAGWCAAAYAELERPSP